MSYATYYLKKNVLKLNWTSVQIPLCVSDVSEQIEPLFYDTFDSFGQGSILLELYSLVKQVDEDFTFSGNSYRILYIMSFNERNKILNRHIYFMCTFNSVYPMIQVKIIN